MNAKSSRDMVDRLESIVEKVNKNSCWISYAAISAMMAFVFVDVILRYFGRPTSGSNDIVQILSVVAVSFAMGYTHVIKRHPTLSLLVSHFPKNMRRSIRIITSTLSMVLFLLLTWQSAKLARHMWVNHEGTMTLGIPVFPMIYGIAFGSALLSFVIIVDLIKLLMKDFEE